MSQIYTRQEISENNGKNGKPLWTIYKNYVYDLTEYLNDHPGGSDLIEEWAGKNCTKAFNEIGHSRDAMNILEKFKIGELEQTTPSKALNDKTNQKNDLISQSNTEKIKKRRIKLLFCM